MISDVLGDHAVSIWNETSPQELLDWFSIGQSIRNGYGLWQGNKELLASCGVLEDPLAADAGSGVIIAALQRRIRETASENLVRAGLGS